MKMEITSKPLALDEIDRKVRDLIWRLEDIFLKCLLQRIVAAT